MSGATRTPPARSWAYWMAYGITAIGAVVSLVYALLPVVAGGGLDPDNVEALYTASRGIALFVVAMVAPIFPVDAPLLLVAAAMTIVLGIDTFIGALQGDLGRAIGSAVLCLATLIAASLLARSDRGRDRD